MEEWRIIDMKYECQPEAVLFSRVTADFLEKKLVPNTLIIRHIPNMSVSMNYYEDPYRDINLEGCRNHNVIVKRRVVSGGGSVILGPDYLGFSLCVDAASLGLTIELLYQRVMFNLVNEATKAFKIPTRYKPLNDGEVWDPEAKIWRKIALSYVGGGSGNALVMGASITFYKPDYEMLALLLTPPAEKFKDKETKDVVQRVANFEEILNRRIEIEERRDIYIKSIENAFDIKLAPHEPLDEEMKQYEDLRKKYVEGDEFLLKKTVRNFGTIPSHVKQGESMVKIPNGPIFQATVLVEGNTLRDILITGTMSAFPTECFENLEDSLRGIEISGDLVRDKIREMYSLGAKTALLSEDNIFQTIKGAINQAGYAF